MDLEAIQLLNLSPIPELSELELSAMMDHLSGLSDINGDSTDRNVEDILKEAEDLLDISLSSKTNEKCSEPEEKNVDNQKISAVEVTCKNKDLNLSNIDVNNSSSEETDNRHYNSPVEGMQMKTFSPGGSLNHIKSTIDSLKEISSKIEQQKSNKSPKSARQYNEKNIPVAESEIKEKLSGLKPSATKTKEPFEKSVKLLNCFERLYQNTPLRLSATRKPKVADKIPKVTTKKKFKDFKSNIKNNKAGWSIKKVYEEDSRSSVSDKSCRKSNYFFPQTPNDFVYQNKLHGLLDDPGAGTKLILSKVDEKLIMKVLEEVEEIKDQVKKAHIFAGSQTSEKVTLGQDAVIGTVKSEVQSVTLAPDDGIKRLEEKFSILKEKYDQQIEKLETENLKLREALNHQQKVPPSTADISPTEQAKNPAETRTTEKPIPLLENCELPRSVSHSSSENLPSTLREAFSQTEKESKNISIQCTEDIVPNEKKEPPDVKKTENKENVLSRNKITRNKPFSEVGIHQFTRQKKLIDHDTQLLATLRGLQAEMSAKDKENRKLKMEIDSLKKQIKKAGANKVENNKRSHVGTQTIGLGPCVQKTYNPEMFEVPKEFEKENEELKSRIRALEEDFELLKKKRINDLQSLHKIHEEEITKLVSKLETQSALTRHLHSLLVNR